MDFFSILTLLGGLAMFLYGMQVMGDGLAKVSGGKLEQILENLTSSKWKAVLLGMCVTAVIQSSSATTVMVVGFVNSGIMKLTQAVGIIMGDVIGDINSRRGRIEGMDDIGGGKMIRGFVPLSEMFGYATDLRSRTQGRGNYSMFFEKYEQVPKSVQEKILSKKD